MSAAAKFSVASLLLLVGWSIGTALLGQGSSNARESEEKELRNI